MLTKLWLFFFIFSGSAKAVIPDVVEVEIPASGLRAETLRDEDTLRAFEANISTIDFYRVEAPSWSESSEFKAKMPLVGVQYVYGKRKISYVTGIGFAAFERQAQINMGGPIFSEEQTAYLTRLHLGFRYDLWKFFYMGASLVPTIAFVNESSIGLSTTASTFPYQLNLGANYSFFTIEAFSENLKNPGFSAGVRIPL